MKFTANKAELLGPLDALRAIAEKKSTIPVLGNILIDAGSDANGRPLLTLTSTDLDVSLRLPVAAEITEPGAGGINGVKFFEMIKLMPDQIAISFESEPDGHQLTIKCAKARYRVSMVRPDAFPEIATPAGLEFFHIASADWCEAVAAVASAMTKEESRYALNGAKFELECDKYRLIATDGHRLHFAEVINAGAAADFDPMSALIPYKALIESARLAETGDLEVAFGEKIFFRVGAAVMSSRLLSGQFPNYELVLPSGDAHEILIDPRIIGRMTRRVALMADERSHAVRFTTGDGQIIIDAQSSDSGESSDAIGTDFDLTPALVNGFNAKYVQDALTGESATLRIQKVKDKAVEVVRSSENIQFRFAIMPMRL